MDNNAQQATSSAMPVPNRGGIPVTSVAAPRPAETHPIEKVVIQDATPQPVIPQPITGSRNKEAEPAPKPFPDAVKMSESEIQKEEIEIAGEIEAMVEASPDSEKPKIPEDVKAAGVEHAKEDTPMPPIQIGVKPLPMSFDEAEFTRKKYKWKDSISWLSDLIIYHWKKLTVKKEEI